MDKVIRRNTRQRSLILEELKKVSSHPDAQTIFRMVKKRMSSIGFGTVYRNLNILKDEGRILELSFGKYGSRYDGCVDDHYHLICLGCGSVVDIKGPSVRRLDKSLGEIPGFKIEYHRVKFYGYCADCSAKKGGRHGNKG